jgi:high-affinity iron transporter
VAESFLIAVREGFEAALIVAIVLAFVRRQAPEQARAVWIGAACAVAVAAAVGLVLHVTVDGLEGDARQRTFAVICVAAAGLLTWMIFWMRRHARSLKGELEGRAGAALATGSRVGLALVAFAAVAREGLETALFLLSTTSANDGGAIAAGTLLGLTVAAALGVAVYHGSRHIDMRRFFLVTGALIILFAAGLLDRAVMLLQSTGDLGSWNGAVYDLTDVDLLTTGTQVGRFLAGIFGWDPRPSLEQVVTYLAFLAPVTFLYLRPPPAAARPAAAHGTAPSA